MGSNPRTHGFGRALIVGIGAGRVDVLIAGGIGVIVFSLQAGLMTRLYTDHGNRKATSAVSSPRPVAITTTCRPLASRYVIGVAVACLGKT